jgi:hypothetical protein
MREKKKKGQEEEKEDSFSLFSSFVFFFFLFFSYLTRELRGAFFFFMPFSFLRARKNILLFLKKSQGWIDRTAGKIKKGMGGWTLGPSIFYLYRQHAICFLYFLKKNDCKSSRWVSEKVK